MYAIQISSFGNPAEVAKLVGMIDVMDLPIKRTSSNVQRREEL